jgi:hypothetical protein
MSSKTAKSDKNAPPDIKWPAKFDLFIILSLLFLISTLYFFIFGSYAFFYQENQSLFIYSHDYFHQFAVKPGGLLEYAGNFITQFYFNSLFGSLVVSAMLTSLAFVFYRIGKKILPVGHLLMPVAVIPSCLFLLYQTNFNFLIHNSLGFLLSALYFLISINSENKRSHILLLILFPLFFYLTGAYVWIFTGMYVLYMFANKKVLYPVIMLTTGFISLLIFKGILFLQPMDELFRYPLPPKDYFTNPILLYILCGFFILYPLIILATGKFIKVSMEYARFFSVYSVLFLFSLAIFIQSGFYNSVTSDLFKLEKLFISGDWDGVIKMQEKTKINNITAQYYYNIALSEKNQLCDRLFFGPQNQGTNSILLQWDSKTSMNTIFRGAYFFYSIGLINEAHRWAYESMVVQGYRPENIKLLIKTELINGHFKVAEKYINILLKTYHYRSLAKHYEAMLYHPELVKSDPELGEKSMLVPKEDFLIRLKDQQANVLLLLESNPGNRKAFEYMMAWYLLERNVDKIGEGIKKMKGMGYTRLPRHIEEAALYIGSGDGELPDLGGLSISQETVNRFRQYSSDADLLGNIFASGETKFKKTFGNTFWYYCGFR